MPMRMHRTEVEEAKDQSGITDLQVELVPFDNLPKHIGRKVGAVWRARGAAAGVQPASLLGGARLRSASD